MTLTGTGLLLAPGAGADRNQSALRAIDAPRQQRIPEREYAGKHGQHVKRVALERAGRNAKNTIRQEGADPQ